jgi:hypothetical protein
MAHVDYLIPMDRFDNPQFIDERLAKVSSEVVGALKTTLSYLYLAKGPINLPRSRLKASEPHLEPAEKILARWLQTRTNGSERKNYGKAALLAARRQRYRCEHCGHADIRVLHLDHVKGHAHHDEFACLCANCHMLKSRRFDWSGASDVQQV